MASNQGPASTTKDYTVWIQPALASVILGAYLVGLSRVFDIASHPCDVNAEKWIDAFKAGFTVLGTGLTTLIGFYFGSKGTADTATRVAETVIRTMNEKT